MNSLTSDPHAENPGRRHGRSRPSRSNQFAIRSAVRSGDPSTAGGVAGALTRLSVGGRAYDGPVTDAAPGLRLARIPAARRGVLEQLAGEILQHYSRGRSSVAVDGRDGAGAAGFADDLAVALRHHGATVFRASVEDFHRPREQRWRAGRYSPEAYYRDAFDYPTLRRVLLDPFRMDVGAGFTLRAFDLAADRAFESEWISGPPDAILLVDGVLLQRPELGGVWNYVVYLDIGARLALERSAARTGMTADPDSPEWRRSLGAQERYEREVHPRTRASAVVDIVDPDAPFRIFSDFC